MGPPVPELPRRGSWSGTPSRWGANRAPSLPAGCDSHTAAVPALRTEITEIVTGLAMCGMADVGKGLQHRPPQLLNVDEATWDAVADLNLKGSYFGAQAAARRMVAQGDGGRIVLSSSVTGSRAIPNLSAYAVTKAALQHMATVLALELGPHGITVNAISIGATVNERNLTDDPEYAEHWAEVLPTGRVGHPEDVAAALSYLVSPEAAMVTGHTLTVDGGWTGMGLTP